jgi:diaminopimelate decarboxylase
MELVNHQYCIKGIPLLTLAEKYGTPLYIYDTDQISKNYQRLKHAFRHTRMRIMYACKALSNLNILRYIHSLGSGLDTVSLNEVLLGLKAGFVPQEIIFTPNCVSVNEIAEASRLGVHINIDNISILEQFGHLMGDSYPICIRLNPHIMAGGHHHLSTGHIDSKFGISVYQMRHVNRVVESTGLRVEGLHMHTGSDILDADVFLQGAEILFEAAMKFKNLRYLDFGSGFKVKYKPDDNEIDINAIGEKISKAFNQFCSDYGSNLELWFEPGKYMVSNSGYFLVKVNVVKQTVATVFAGVNSGFNHLIRPMFYDAYHHIENISNPPGSRTSPERIYTVVGQICETDTFAWDRSLREIREGDILCFYNAGAYGYEMSMNYNSHFRPAEVMIYEGRDYLIRQRETMEDLTRNIVEAEVLQRI